MEKIILLFIIIPVLCIPCTAQIVFNRTYDNNNLNEAAVSILSLDHNEYLLSGRIFNSSGFNAGILTKIDEIGDTIWNKFYDFTTGGEILNKVILSADSNFIATGTTQDTNGLHSAAMILKVDTSGNVIWWKRYGGFYNEVGRDLKETKDGGYIMAGWTSSNTNQPNPNFYEDGYVVKIDSGGNVEWETQFGDSLSDVFYSVDTTRDGGYILGGFTYSYGNNKQLWMVKIDSLGNFEWQKTFGGPNLDFGKDVIQTLDGGYIISGNYQTVFLGNKNAYIVKTDSAGNMEWDKQFNFTDFEEFDGLKQIADSSYYLSGTTDTNYYEGFLIKLNQFGDSLWTKFYRYYPFISNYQQHYIYGMELLNDGFIAMCGMASDNNSGQLTNMWLVIADSTGCADTSCLTTGINMPLQNHSSAGIFLYPNPAIDYTNINFSSELFQQQLELNLIDVTGRIIFSENIIPRPNEFGIPIPTTNLSQGIYFVKVKCPDKEFSHKLIKL